MGGPVPVPYPVPNPGWPHLRVSVYSPWILLDASRTRKVPSGVSRSFSFTSSLWGQHAEPTDTAAATAGAPAWPRPYLEMSPQYHSASCREGGLPPLARPGGAVFTLEGFGGRAGGQRKAAR